MKLSNVTVMVGKVMTIGLVAGAVALVAPAKADAQQVVFGVQYGAPYYQDYGETRRDYYRHEQWERERERQAAIAQHEAWERQQAWDRHEQHERWEHARGYDRGYDRDGGYRNGTYGYAVPQGYYGR